MPYVQVDGFCTHLVALLGVWSAVVDLLQEWTLAYGPIMTLTGPIFDYNVDGLKDTEFDL